MSSEIKSYITISSFADSLNREKYEMGMEAELPPRSDPSRAELWHIGRTLDRFHRAVPAVPSSVDCFYHKLPRTQVEPLFAILHSIHTCGTKRKCEIKYG